jgi:hypothetical protein
VKRAVCSEALRELVVVHKPLAFTWAKVRLRALTWHESMRSGVGSG